MCHFILSYDWQVIEPIPIHDRDDDGDDGDDGPDMDMQDSDIEPANVLLDMVTSNNNVPFA